MRTPTFQDRYCAAHHCTPPEFCRRVFWRSLHRHALPLALVHPDFFVADRELIELAGRVRTMHELHGEIRDYLVDRRVHTWWRGRAHVRVSTRRLRALARPYLSAPVPLPLPDARHGLA